MIKEMAATNVEAAEEVKDLLDEAFEAFSSIPNAAAQFVDFAGKSGNVESVKDWSGLVIGHLKEAKKLLDDFCSLSSGDGRLATR